MTNQEAIKTLYEYRHCLWDKLYEPIRMAIKALEQEPSGDLISRQAVLDGIEELKKSPWATANRSHGYEYLITEALGVVADLCVKQASSVTPQEKTGHWIKSNIPNEEYICSECGGGCWYYDYQANVAKSRYCPNCGARMVEPQESEGNE